MGSLLEKPVIDKDTLVQASAEGLKFGLSSMQGWRVEMEDAHTVEADVDGLKGHSFLAVYDGHGGAYSAKFASLRMLGFVRATDQYKKYAASVGKENNPKLLEEALYLAFLAADADLRKEAEAQNDRSGCTAVAAFVTPTHIVMAHAGDSRAVMFSGGEVVARTDDHKPYNDDEMARIERAGGCVTMKRVDGDLAVSRALGDFQYKDESHKPEECKVTAAPETQSHPRDNAADELLVIACDGIWDVMSDEDCIETVKEILGDGEKDLGLASEELLDLCLERGSRDNMSAIIVSLPACEWGTGEGVLGRRKRRELQDAQQDGDGALQGDDYSPIIAGDADA